KITNLYSTNEIVVLANDKTLLQNLKNNNYECYSIIEAKGLEFSKVLVIDYNLSLTEKYIAYTRTLDKLFIYHVK
ncbi:MAG: hypothetical protein PHE54_03495, partial [Bacilli bacterium]|nr:hypothetical protein [Bacilli bacterium]